MNNTRQECAKDTEEAREVLTYKSNSSDAKIRVCCDGQSKIRHHKKGNGAVSLAPLLYRTFLGQEMVASPDSTYH